MKLLASAVLLLFGGWKGCLLGRLTEAALVNSVDTTPSWDELDARPLPVWYDQAKLGIFIHWGVFAVPSYGSEWFWAYWKDMNPHVYGGFVNATERPGFTYQEYASRFTAELYRPEEWAKAFAQVGAQYVVLTSKHHEGFCTSARKNRGLHFFVLIVFLAWKRQAIGTRGMFLRLGIGTSWTLDPSVISWVTWQLPSRSKRVHRLGRH
jgi:Alpha-L-fucosidase